MENSNDTYSNLNSTRLQEETHNSQNYELSSYGNRPIELILPSTSNACQTTEEAMDLEIAGETNESEETVDQRLVDILNCIVALCDQKCASLSRLKYMTLIKRTPHTEELLRNGVFWHSTSEVNSEDKLLSNPHNYSIGDLNFFTELESQLKCISNEIDSLDCSLVAFLTKSGVNETKSSESDQSGIPQRSLTTSQVSSMIENLQEGTVFSIPNKTQNQIPTRVLSQLENIKPKDNSEKSIVECSNFGFHASSEEMKSMSKKYQENQIEENAISAVFSPTGDLPSVADDGIKPSAESVTLGIVNYSELNKEKKNKDKNNSNSNHNATKSSAESLTFEIGNYSGPHKEQINKDKNDPGSSLNCTKSSAESLSFEIGSYSGPLKEQINKNNQDSNLNGTMSSAESVTLGIMNHSELHEDKTNKDSKNNSDSKHVSQGNDQNELRRVRDYAQPVSDAKLLVSNSSSKNRRNESLRVIVKRLVDEHNEFNKKCPAVSHNATLTRPADIEKESHPPEKDKSFSFIGVTTGMTQEHVSHDASNSVPKMTSLFFRKETGNSSGSVEYHAKSVSTKHQTNNYDKDESKSKKRAIMTQAKYSVLCSTSTANSVSESLRKVLQSVASTNSQTFHPQTLQNPHDSNSEEKIGLSLMESSSSESKRGQTKRMSEEETCSKSVSKRLKPISKTPKSSKPKSSKKKFDSHKK